MYMYMYIYIYIRVTYIYIYTHRERERVVHVIMCVYIQDHLDERGGEHWEIICTHACQVDKMRKATGHTRGVALCARTLFCAYCAMYT